MITQNNKMYDKYIFNDLYLKRYREYQSFLETLNLKADTIEWRLKHIRGFLFYLEDKKISFYKMNYENIYNYMDSISELASRTKEHRAICIRLFLNWLYEKGYIKINGKTVLPFIKCNKNSTLISCYSKDEITTLINSIDSKERNGKRDLAVILLFAHLGLRLTDVKMLKLSNIKWNENRIIMIQSKTNYLSSYAMNDDLRYALIDYLKNERPKTNFDYFFIDDNEKTYSSSAYYNIVNKYFMKAKINTKGKKHGPHSLRHSLATISLNNKHSIYEIATILGHRNVETTKIYSKVDIKSLKKLSLEVPAWKI